MRGVRARFWLRWAVRDARLRRGQVLSIALVLALGVGMYVAMSSMSVWRVRSADASFGALRMHDLRLSLVEGDSVGEGTLRAALRVSGAQPDVTGAAERLVVARQVDVSHDGRRVIVPGRLVGAPLQGPVDAVRARRGTLPAAAAVRGLPAVALEHNFARHYDLPATGTLRLSGGRRVAYTGQVLAPEYFIVTAPGADFGAEAAFAVVFAPLRTVQTVTGLPGRVNDLVLRLRPGADTAAVRRQLTRALHAARPQLGFTITGREQEPAHRLIYKDAEGDQRMLDAFAFLLLAAAAFAAFNLVSRSVEAQRQEIGIGMALGVPPRALARRPLLLSAQVAALGVLLGIPVGLAADAWLAGVMDRFFPLPETRVDFQTGYYLQGALLGLLLPPLAAVVPVRRAVRVAPVEAIRVGARAGRGSGLSWLLKDLRLPGGALANLPLRNVLRAPRRTLMTLLGIGAVVTIVVAMSGVMDSFSRTLSASRSEALAGDARRLTVDLTQPAPASGAVVARVAHDPAVASAQPSLRLPSRLSSGAGGVNVVLEAIPDAQPLWHPTLTAGALPRGRPGLAIARPAAAALDVDVGDEVRVRHPGATRAGTSRMVTTRLPVTAVHSSPLRFVAYANRAAADAMQITGVVNRISIVPSPGLDGDDAKAALVRLPTVGAVQGAAATTDAVDRRLSQFNDILLVVVAIAAAMALLIAYNAAAINSDERAREHATMFAHGVTSGRVLRGTVLEALIIGALGTLTGLAAGHALLRWLVDTNLAETMPDVGTLVQVAPGTYVLAAATGMIAVAAAPLMTFRRLRDVDIPSALRIVE